MSGRGQHPGNTRGGGGGDETPTNGKPHGTQATRVNAE